MPSADPITPAALRSWALLGRLSQGQPPGGHLVILHHTDCGITRLADYPEQLAAFFEIPAHELASKAVADPYAAVRIDAAIARHALPPGRLVSRGGLRREHRAHRDRRPGHQEVMAAGRAHRRTHRAQPGRSSGRLAASLPCSRPVAWPTSIRYPSGSRR